MQYKEFIQNIVIFVFYQRDLSNLYVLLKNWWNTLQMIYLQYEALWASDLISFFILVLKVMLTGL